MATTHTSIRRQSKLISQRWSQCTYLRRHRNALPFDPNGPWYTSGLRIGTPAVTTLGMGSKEMKEIAAIIALVLKNTSAATITKGEKAGTLSKARFVTSEDAVQEARKRVAALLSGFKLYPELDLEFLEEFFPLDIDC